MLTDDDWRHIKKTAIANDGGRGDPALQIILSLILSTALFMSGIALFIAGLHIAFRISIANMHPSEKHPQKHR